MQSSQVAKTSLKTTEVDAVKTTGSPPRSLPEASVQNDVNEGRESVPPSSSENSRAQGNESGDQVGTGQIETSTSQKPTNMLNGPVSSARRPAIWGRTPVSTIVYLGLQLAKSVTSFLICHCVLHWPYHCPYIFVA